jgi:hypothetical protein
MKDLEQELFTYLSNRPAILALLSADGTLANCRIFPDQAPQSAIFPRVTYQRISDVGIDHMGGGSDLSHALFQVDVWAMSSADRKAVSNAVRSVLHGAQRFSMGEVGINSIRLRGETDSVVDEEAGDDVPISRTRMDFSIWYQRTAPAFTL